MNYADPNIHLGISNKSDGPMKNSSENRFQFLKRKGFDNRINISADLVHKNRVVVVEEITSSQSISSCDALITNQDKHLLTLTVADCLPIYFYDRNRNVVALAHAGWRGVVSNIAKEVISIFIDHYHSNVNDIEIYIGPHIQDCHFEVKEDVASQFRPSDSIIRDDKTFISLSRVVRNQLLQLNIVKENIQISTECTYCLDKKYYSYRRDRPQELETMLTYIGLK